MTVIEGVIHELQPIAPAVVRRPPPTHFKNPLRFVNWRALVDCSCGWRTVSVCSEPEDAMRLAERAWEAHVRSLQELA